MSEKPMILINHQEMLRLIFRDQNIHEGVWSIVFEVSQLATNVLAQQQGTDRAMLTPATISFIQRIGITPCEDLNDLSADAAEVNPKPARKVKKKK